MKAAVPPRSESESIKEGGAGSRREEGWWDGGEVYR